MALAKPLRYLKERAERAEATIARTTQAAQSLLIAGRTVGWNADVIDELADELEAALKEPESQLKWG